MSMTKAEKATAYFGMTRKYLSMMKKLSNAPKLFDNFEDYESHKLTTRKEFADSLTDNEIHEFFNSSYSSGWKMFHELEKDAK